VVVLPLVLPALVVLLPVLLLLVAVKLVVLLVQGKCYSSVLPLM
jgi:hypothetical protein